MALQYTPYTAPVFLAAVIGFGVALFALRHKERPGARSLALFMIGTSFWSFAEAMNLANADLAGKMFWTNMEIAISGIIPMAFLLLVLEYTGNEQWIRPKMLAVLLIEPVLNTAVVWLRPELVRPSVGLTVVNSFTVVTETFGPAYYGHLIYSYLVILIAGALLMRVILFAEGLYRTQATALLVAGFVPVIGNVMYTFELLPAGIDPTNVGFLFTGFIIAATILRRQLLEVVPVAREVARDEILENMDDRVIVLDENDLIADLNPTAVDLLNRTEDEAIGKPIEEVLPDLAALLETNEEGRIQQELSLEKDNSVRYYDVRVSPLHRASGMITGRLISLRDVTEQRQQRQRLNVLNRLLRHNLRNEMNVIVGNAELVGRNVSDDSLTDRIERIEATASEITTRSDKVGRVARMLDEDDSKPLDVEHAVSDEVDRARDRYPEAEITVDVSAPLWADAGNSITIAISELLSNAIQHNDGDPVVQVTAYEDDHFVNIVVSDNGPGISEHELDVLEEGKETALQHGSGVGLWVVNWVVRQFGGQILFENDDDGCTVTMQLPRLTDEEPLEPDESPADGDAQTRPTSAAGGDERGVTDSVSTD